MKRLKLVDFKANNKNSLQTNELLGQVLGDCHDDPNKKKKKKGTFDTDDNITHWFNPL